MDSKIASKAVTAPQNLTKEQIGVWLGWSSKGNREVCREAAAKGQHINLALNFLSQRMELDQDSVKQYFHNQVLLWVDELLQRRQIFRATHVLQNLGSDPFEELSNIFSKTVDRDLRQYVGNHLLKQDKLNAHLDKLWQFLEIILKQNLVKYKLEEESIDFLDRQEAQWKFEIASKIFLRNHDLSLLPFLDGFMLWKQLLHYNDIKYLKSWIQIHNKKSSNAPEPVNTVFKSFPITDEMLNYLTSEKISLSTRILTLNEFAKFGQFTEDDKSSLVKILKRVAQANTLHQLNQTLQLKSCNCSIDHYLKLLVNYCQDNNFLTLLNYLVEGFDLQQVSHKHLDLIQSFRNLFQDFSEANITRNVILVSELYIEEYFNINPTISLALILLNRFNFNFDTEDVELDTNSDIVIKTKPIFSKYPLLAILYKKVSSELSYLDLLQSVSGLKVNEVFGRVQGVKHFNNLAQFSYGKKLNYILYLKQFRPSSAAKQLLLDRIEPEVVLRKVYKLAINNFRDLELISSCLSFLEMVNLKNELRVILRVANILTFSYNDDQIKQMLLNLSNETIEAVEIIVLSKLDFNGGVSLVEALKHYEIVFQLARAGSCSFPLKLLERLAMNNDWLSFLIVAQIKGLDWDRLKVAMQRFRSPVFIEHLGHSAQHEIQDQPLMRDRDSRQSFLSRIGVRKTFDLTDSHSSLSSLTTHSTGSGCSVGSDLFDTELNSKATLLQTLIRCHNSADPPRALLQACQLYKNPLLAILATSYEPDSIVTNWLTYLSVSCQLNTAFINFETTASSPNLVTALLQEAAIKGLLKTVLESFNIFLPENALKPFISFLLDCVEDNEQGSIKIDQFYDSLNRSRRNSVYTEADHEMNYLNNKLWLEKTALSLLGASLACNCSSLHHQISFLKKLIDLEVRRCFGLLIDFKSVLEIVEVIARSGLDISIDLRLMIDPKTKRKAVIDCINGLLDMNCYEVALNIAKIECLPLDLIVIKQWQYKFSAEEINEAFWLECNEAMLRNRVTADCVIDFYMECLDKVNSFEQYLLLKFSLQLAQKFDLSNRYELETKLWLCYVQLEDKFKNVKELESDEEGILYKDILESLDNFKQADYNPELKTNLENLLKEVLNCNNLHLALKLEKIFELKNNDLELLKIGNGLAEGIILPFQLDLKQRLLLTKGGNFRKLSYRKTFSNRLFSGNSSSPGSCSFHPDTVDTPFQDALAMLYSLTEKISNGQALAHKVFLLYRISINIEIPYQIVALANDPMKLLKDSLEDNCNNKLEVVHDFVAVCNWTKEQVADFMCEEIINAAQSFVKSQKQCFELWDVDVDKDFGQILQLLHDNCSLLGQKLFSYACALHKVQLTEVDFKISELALVIELLILSHDCFTADCNMEGITMILNKCQSIVSDLLTLRSWKLIVRLLTGIGRYTEMKYVFQILRENDQFEFLLRKGSRKDNALRSALLDYLKRHCPDNKDLFKIVALHFALFSEVALLWEREALRIIDTLIKISKMEMINNKLNPETHSFILLTHSSGTLISLNMAIENFTHATEFHLQGEKLVKGLNAAKQAELLALQIGLLKSVQVGTNVICVLQLNQQQIATLVSNVLSFDQAQILIEAYDYQVDWGSVLFERCVLKGDLSYLDEYLKHFALSEAIVFDISRKFLNANLNGANELKNMRNVLVKSNSVHAKYRIASELGFVDLVEYLVSGSQLAYLKDTVWKKGYKDYIKVF